MARSEAFHRILIELGELHDKKSADYGTDSDPFSNIRFSHWWGVPPIIGVLVRIGDKLARLQTWTKTRKLSNEGVADTFRDIAVYCIIALVLLAEDGEEKA